jgi:hypothetical protein
LNRSHALYFGYQGIRHRGSLFVAPQYCRGVAMSW